MNQWDSHYLDRLGYELWSVLCENHMPGDEATNMEQLACLDTIRYVLWLSDPEQEWASGIFNKKRITEHVWDKEHMNVYENSQQ